MPQGTEQTLRLIKEALNNYSSVSLTVPSSAAIKIASANPSGPKRTYLLLQNHATTDFVRVGAGFEPTSTHQSLVLSDVGNNKSHEWEQSGDHVYQGDIWLLATANTTEVSLLLGYE